MDRYTKSVLTIIMCALLVIAAENGVRPSTAQTSPFPQKVQICDSFGTHCADLAEIQRQALGTTTSHWVIPVLIDNPK